MSTYLWLGAFRTENESMFQWTDGRILGNNDPMWSMNHPTEESSNSTSCVQIDSLHFTLVNYPCTDYDHFVCEVRLQV